MFERVSRNISRSKNYLRFAEEVYSVQFEITVKSVSRDISMDQRIKGIKK